MSRDISHKSRYSNLEEERPLDLSVVILTFNEALHIERAIRCVKPFAREVVVIDSFSTDQTVDLAIRAGARVLQNPFTNQAKQLQWALDCAELSTAWIMRLDADEVVEPDLVANLRSSLPGLCDDVVGINLERKHVFMNRWIRYGGRYPLSLLRIWRRGQGRPEERWMDEHIVVWGGRTVSIKGGFADINLNNIDFFIAKHNKYATREAVERLTIRLWPRHVDKDLALVKLGSLQVSRKRWLKEKIYNKLPVGVGPTIYFWNRYILQLGFLDGAAGLIYHFLQGYWYRFLVDAKTFELARELSSCGTDAEMMQRLSLLTGLEVDCMA